MDMQTIQNGADLVLLYQPLNLYLKPQATLTITITLPSNVAAGKAISNFDVMDKLRQMILPDKFSILKVSKTTMEYLRFEAELDDRNKLKNVTSRLDGRKVKLTGFTEYAQIKASETKCDFATRHDWDSFFRDAKNMDEMKAGERPDTIYLSNLPIRWFCPRHSEKDENVKPSESLFKRLFEKFGEVRVIDIPICDPYRNQMKPGLTGLKNFSFDNETYFEGYVQFSEYGSFVRAMDEFRGMKLVRKDIDKLLSINIQVTFDQTKHLSDASAKRRKVIRDRLIEKDREKAEEEEKKLRAEQELKEKERQKEEAKKQVLLDKQRQREERRKQKYMQKISQEESSELTKKIHKEQKKLLKAQRKVESIRLLEVLFGRIKTKYSAEDIQGPTKGFKGFDLRSKLNKKSKPPLIKPSDIKKERSLSITSISSNDSILSDSKQKKKKRRDSSSSSSSSSSSGSSSTRDRKKKKTSESSAAPSNGMYPGWMNNPETGEWIPAHSYMYPAPFFPGMVRPYYNPNYRGGFAPRSRGRGRGRGYYSNYNSNFNSDSRYNRRYDDDDDYYKNQHDRRSPRRRHSRSYSRSRSRSKSRSHRRRRSYSRSRSSSRSKSRSKSQSKSRSSRPYKRSSHSSSKAKLVTTLRDGDTSKPPPSTRRNRSRSGSGWSSDGYRKSGRAKKSWSRDFTPQPREKAGLEPEKLLKSAREIQIHVQQKLKEQEEAKEKRMKELQSNGSDDDNKRSASVDSSSFRSPKRTAKSFTPDITLAP